MNHKTTPKYQLVLWVVLLITLGLTVWTALNDDESEVEDDDAFNSTKSAPLATVVKPNTSKDKQQNATQPELANNLIPWDALKRSKHVEKPRDLFAMHSWTVIKQKPKLRPSSPPKVKVKQAPAIPFAYTGKLENAPYGTLVFLKDHAKIYSVKLGENVNPDWQLIREDEHQLTFTYLPLNLTKVLYKRQQIAPLHYPKNRSEMDWQFKD